MATPSSGRPRGRPPYPLLTPAEERVLQQLRRGLTNAEIAERLGVTLDAVKYHVSNMLGKLEVENREQLAAWREPAGVRRAWAGVAGLGWKVAVAGGLAAAAAVTVGGVLLSRSAGGRVDGAASNGDALPLVLREVGPPDSAQGGVLSADGKWLAYAQRGPLGPTVGFPKTDVWLLEVATGETRLVSADSKGSPAAGNSTWPAVSGDGRYVAFQSTASNIVPDDRNGDIDRIDAALPAVMRDSTKGVTGESRAAFLGDIGGSDVFVFDRETGAIERVSVSTSGGEGDWGSRRPSISADGGRIAFESHATNLVENDTNFGQGSSNPYPVGGADIFVHDRSSGTTTRVSVAAINDQAQGSSAEPFISASGREVSFISDALNFPAGSHSVMKGYLRDGGAETRLMSVPLSGSEIPQHSVDAAPRISADGNFVAFAAINYWNRTSALYLYDRGASRTEELWSADGDEWNQRDYRAVMSPDGRYVLFCAPGPMVTDGSWTHPSQLFKLHDTQSRTTHDLTLGGAPAAAVVQMSISDTGTIVLMSAGSRPTEFRLLLGELP